MRPVFYPSAQSESLEVLGSTIRPLITGGSSGGVMSLFDVAVDRAGVGVPAHVHHCEDEVFHVEEGSVKFVVEGVETIATAGQTAFGPRGIAHSWEALEPSRFLVAVTPAGLEQMFRELSTVSPGEDSFEQAVRICRRHAVDFV